MRISTNQIYQRGLSGMLSQQAQLLKLQEQVASGKRVNTSSDDPIAAAQIVQMKQRILATEGLERNRSSAESSLKTEESIISNTISVMQRVRELQVQAGNTSLSADDRKAIASEAEVLLNQLYDLANSKDASGAYLFAGGQNNSQPFTRDANGQPIYNGDDTRRYQAISAGLQVAVNDPGSDLFMRIRNGNGIFSVSQTGAANAGTVIASTGAVADFSAYVADDYTVSFAQNTAGQMVVMVTGAASGNVIPPSGNPDDAPLYESGAGVIFNGINIQFSGTPAVGDDFRIQPAENESIFSTVKAMVDNLRAPYTTASDKAATQTVNNQILSQLDNAMDNFVNIQSDLGARLNQLEVAEMINGDALDGSAEILKILEEIEPNEAYVSLNRQMIALQAAQMSFAKIQNLSALQYF